MSLKTILKLLCIAVFSVALTSPAFAYSDVSSKTDYANAINYITAQGLAGGYADGTFQPQGKVTRAEFIKMLILSKIPENFSPDTYSADCFTDVGKNDWFSGYVCYAKTQNIISGYQDGSFGPNDYINIAEAAKMLVNQLLKTPNPDNTSLWYVPFIDTLALDKYIPPSVKYLNQDLKRGEVAELIYRIKAKISDQTSSVAASLEKSFCQNSPENIPSNIDLEKVRAAWLGWYNTARAAQGLPPYQYDVQLDRTAAVWSENAKKLGYISHKRPGQTAYYDYNIIKNWFADLGLQFANVNRETFVENINWNYYKCSEADCTQYLIDDIKSGYDFFMSEKGKAYSPHYDSIMNKEFKEIGLGIAIDQQNTHKYYLTVHYATAITSNPPAICP